MTPGARRREPAGAARGFALIVVLWFLVLFAAIGTYLMANARSETALARNILVGARAEALADAGVAQAVFNLTDPVVDDRWKLDGAPHTVRLPGGEATIQLYDESQKINPNLASETLMAGLFEALGVDRAHARQIGAAIADWVDRDDKARPSGAERDQYEADGRSYGPANAPFDSVEELQLVLGVTPDLFAAARPYLTIHTEAEAPDAKTAPAIVQRALAIAAQADGDADAAEQSAASGASSAPAADASDAVASPPAAGEAPGTAAASGATGAGAAKPDGADQPVVANVVVTARSGEGGTFVRRAVLRIDGSDPKGYVVLDWRRADVAD